MKHSVRFAGALLAFAGTTVLAQETGTAPAPEPAADAAAAAAAAAPATPPKPKWETSAGVGVSVTQGNSDTLLFTANVVTLRKWEHHEFSAGVDAGYGKTDGTQNIGFVKGFSQYNYLINQRLYGFGRVEGLNDAIADITYRVPISAGIGYYIIKNDKITLSAEVGPGYVFEKVGDDERDFATVRFGEKFTWKLSETARLWQSFEYQPKIDEWTEYYAAAEIGIGAAVTKHAELRITLQDWYVSNPAPNRESNDLKLIAGVNYKF